MKKMRNRLILSIVLVFCMAGPGPAQEEPQPDLVLTLQDCLERALVHSPKVEKADLEIREAEWELTDAEWERLDMEFFDVVGAVEDTEGGDTDYCFFNKMDFSVRVPVYTFGQISHGLKGAEKNIDVKKAESESARGDLAVRVHELYYGLILADQLHGITEELHSNFTEAVDIAEERLEEGKSGVTETDILKLKVGKAGVTEGLHRLRRDMQVTREALRREIGLEENVDFAVAEDRLQKVEFPMKDQGFFLNSAEKRNAQIKRMDAALEAQQNAYLSEKGKYYPKVLLVGGARYTAAPGCEDPDDSFLDDDDLGLSGGGTVAFQWNPNLFETNAEVMEEKMKYLQMKSRYREGTSGIKLQVKERYLSVLEKSERVEASWEARKSGRALLFLNLTNFKLGIGSGSDVFEALSLYARTASDYYKRVFDYNMAVAKLKEVCGILLEVPEEAPASAEETTEAAKESQPPVSNAESK